MCRVKTSGVCRCRITHIIRQAGTADDKQIYSQIKLRRAVVFILLKPVYDRLDVERCLTRLAVKIQIKVYDLYICDYNTAVPQPFKKLDPGAKMADLQSRLSSRILHAYVRKYHPVERCYRH